MADRARQLGELSNQVCAMIKQALVDAVLQHKSQSNHKYRAKQCPNGTYQIQRKLLGWWWNWYHLDCNGGESEYKEVAEHHLKRLNKPNIIYPEG